MKPRPILITAVAICSSAGFMAGRVSPKSQDAASQEHQKTAAGPRAGRGTTGQDEAPRGLRPIGPLAVGKDRISNIAEHDDLIIRLSLILNHPDSIERSEAWLNMVKEMTSDDIAEAVSIFTDARNGMQWREHPAEFAMLLHAWVAIDPHGAIDNTRSNHHKRAVLSSWAAIDPDSALHWAESQHDGSGPNPWMPMVIQGLASTDPKLATQLMMELEGHWQRLGPMEAIHKHYLRQDSETARSWALGISDPELRDLAIAKIAVGQARTEPMGAAQWLLANPGDRTIHALGQVMEKLTLSNAQSAIDFMETISDPSLKSCALEGIANELSSIDPQATLTLIDAHPELVRDDIVSELIWGARESEPALGANAISRIVSERLREQTYMQYLSQWARGDREAAAEWLNQSNISTNNRETLEWLVRSPNTSLNTRQPTNGYRSIHHVDGGFEFQSLDGDIDLHVDGDVLYSEIQTIWLEGDATELHTTR